MIKLNENIYTKQPDSRKCSNVHVFLPSPTPEPVTLQTIIPSNSYRTEVFTAFLHLLIANSWLISPPLFLISPSFLHIFFSTSSPRMVTNGSFTTNQPTQTHPFPQNIVSNLGPMEKINNPQKLIYRIRNLFIPWWWAKFQISPCLSHYNVHISKVYTVMLVFQYVWKKQIPLLIMNVIIEMCCNIFV